MKYYYQSINFIRSSYLFNRFVNFSFIVYHFKFIRKFVLLYFRSVAVKVIERVILVGTSSFLNFYDHLKIFIVV